MSDRVTVAFQHAWEKYKPGDRAGFPPHVARALCESPGPVTHTGGEPYARYVDGSPANRMVDGAPSNRDASSETLVDPSPLAPPSTDPPEGPPVEPPATDPTFSTEEE